MKHVHAEMIKAKADDMSLIVFVKCGHNSAWRETETPTQFPLSEFDDVQYFLCLPQHKEVCLHWLNGGDIQVLDSNWINVHPVESYPWEDEHDFMCEDSKIRIKPKKEKRLIVYRNDVVYGPYLSIDDINPDLMATGQVVEIEVEV